MEIAPVIEDYSPELLVLFLEAVLLNKNIVLISERESSALRLLDFAKKMMFPFDLEQKEISLFDSGQALISRKKDEYFLLMAPSVKAFEHFRSDVEDQAHLFIDLTERKSELNLSKFERMIPPMTRDFLIAEFERVRSF